MNTITRQPKARNEARHRMVKSLVKKSSQLLLTLGLFAAIFAAFAVSLMGDKIVGRADAPPLVAPVAGCDLNLGPCRTALADGRGVTLALTPTPVEPMRPLRVVVALDGMPAAGRGAIDFSGVDMDMGVNRFRLVQDGPGRLTGEAMLPVCVRNSMLWEATVILPDADAPLHFPFRFETRRP